MAAPVILKDGINVPAMVTGLAVESGEQDVGPQAAPPETPLVGEETTEAPDDQAEEVVFVEAPEEPTIAEVPVEEFNPYNFTVAEVKEWVTAHPDQRDEVLAAEAAGKNRSTLTEWLSTEEIS